MVESAALDVSGLGVVSAYGFNRTPLSNASPFTYREGATYLSILEGLVDFLNEKQIPELNGILKQAETMILNYMDFMDAELSNAKADIASSKAAWQVLFDEFMADVTAQIALLNDNAVSGLIENVASATGVSLREVMGLEVDSTTSAVSQALNKRYRSQYMTTAKGDWDTALTDDTAALQADIVAAQAERLPLALKVGGVYGISSTLNFPPNFELITNGAIFIKTSNNAVPAITVAGYFTSDNVTLFLQGGALADAGLHITGSNVRIASMTVQAMGSNQLGSTMVKINGTVQLENIWIDKLTITGFRSPFLMQNVKNFRIGFIDINNFVTGAYFRDCSNGIVAGGDISGTSVSATGGPGENGVLIESTIADYSCENLTFTNVVVNGAPEHSFRIGGSLSVANVTFDKCISKNSGNAANNVSTGGGAFKALGVVGHWHTNIRYINCTSEDASVTLNALNNASLFSFGFCSQVTVDSPVIRKRLKAFSGRIAFYLNSVTDIRVRNASFRDLNNRAVIFAKDGTDNSLTGISNVEFHGEIHSETVNNLIAFETAETVTKNVWFDVVCDKGGMAFRSEAATTVGNAVGAYENVNMKIRYINAPTATGSTPISGGNNAVVDYSGPVYGVTIPSKDGGYLLNTDTGARSIRKGLTWLAM